MSIGARRTLLFRRDFRGLTGGHIKVWHYFQHAAASRSFTPRIHLTTRSFQFADNPWQNIHPPSLPLWEPRDADVLFLAGLDWEVVADPAPRPVINLIQHVRHADPGDPRRPWLARPAVRICVSAEVAEEILATGLVNGPVFVIPNAIDLAGIPQAEHKDIGVLIAAVKNPGFGKQLQTQLEAAGVPSKLLTHKLPHDAFLSLLARTAVAVTLPRPREGFFLVALEAMAAGALVVCPDCVGNRSFCRDDENCLRPDYTLEAVLQATLTATRLGPQQREAMHAAAAIEAAQHTLEAEREAFLSILEGL